MRKKIDRKAWIRIMEAFLAILIITAVLLVILSQKPRKIDIEEDIYLTQRNILNIISKNEEMRNEILTTGTLENNQMVSDKIEQMLSPGFDFATKICELAVVCNPGNLPIDKNVYSTEVVITSSITTPTPTYAPKKLRFFVWIKD